MEEFHYWDENGIEHTGWRVSDEEKRRRAEARTKARQNRKETPAEMVRALQGIFCRGRYRSWSANAGRYSARI